MNYVKHHNILGVEAKEIPCIVGTGAPDNTINKIGLLYMNQSTGEIYKCAASGWELLVSDANTTVEADSSVAYTKTAPANALPYAEITEIGGMTRKCENFIKEGTVNFTRVKHITFDPPLPAGTYTFSALITSTGTDTEHCGAYFYDSDDSSIKSVPFLRGSRQSKTFTLTSPAVILDLYAEEKYSNSEGDTATWADMMLNEGSTALPYEPYFEGLRSAPVSAVESVGKNICPVASITTNEIQSGAIQIYGIKKHGQYTLSADITKYADDTATNTRITIVVNYTDGTKTELGCAIDASSSESDGVARRKKVTINTDTTKTISRITLYALNYSTPNNRNAKAENICFVYGTDTEYTPYVKNTIEIPEAVRPAHGTPNGAYDSIEWQADGAIKSYTRCGVVDMGTLEWSSANSVPEYYAYSVKISDMKIPTVLAERATGILCAKYTNWAGSTLEMPDKTMLRHESGYIYVTDTDYTDVATFKAAMSGVMLYYELAEPIITDISDILGANSIPVEEGGTVTFVNEYNYDVPNKINFYTSENVQEAIGAKKLIGELIGNASSADTAKVADRAIEADTLNGPTARITEGHGWFAGGASTASYKTTSGLTADTTPQFRNTIIVDSVPTDLSSFAIGDIVLVKESVVLHSFDICEYSEEAVSIYGRYNYEEGMTWGEFISSEYNAEGHFTENEYGDIRFYNGNNEGGVSTSAWSGCTSSDIISDSLYYLMI